MLRRFALVVMVAAVPLLAGCEMLGMESAEKLSAQREAESRAVGAACRHAARAIEDCFALNKRADKAAIFAGWREMNDYMRENKIEPVAPTLTAQGKPDAPEAAARPAETDAKPKPKKDS